MAHSKRLIFLAGAPDADSLSWDKEDLLFDFQQPLQRFLSDSPVNHGPKPISTSTGPQPKWRHVPFDNQRPIRMPDYGPSQTQNLTQVEQSGQIDELERSNFLEHSFALLDDLDLSQIVTAPNRDDDGEQSELETTFLSFTDTSLTESSFRTSIGSFEPTSQNRISKVDGISSISGPITDLKHIPSADHITRMQPQTITVNLLAGIISISPTRTVRLRRRDADMDIIEVTVGDETRAGFSVSFWLVPVESQQRPKDDLREILCSLRSGDVACIQNVALSCFRGSVYGQSLSKRFAKNSTSVTVLKDDFKQNSSAVIMNKLKRVREWTNDFVGIARKRESFYNIGTASGGRRKTDELPPDTQD